MELSTVKIPQIIMQTWKTQELPPQWQASQDAIRLYMSEWKYVLMTDDMNLAFVKTYFPDFLKSFLAFPYPVQRADAIRYMWFYVHGGLYLDLDVCILRSLNPLFYSKKDLYVIKSMYFSSTYTNALIASQVRTPVMLKCLDLMSIPLSIERSLSKHFIVVNSTGPNMFTQAIEETKNRYGDSFTVGELPTNLILSDAYADPDDLNNPQRYARLLGGSSWVSNDSKAMLFTFHNRKVLGASLLFLVVVLALIKLKNKRVFY